MLKKPVKDLSSKQIELLLNIWIEAHNALDHKRQPFKRVVSSSDEGEWSDLISSGYIEAIPDECDRFILTSDADKVYDVLIKQRIHSD